MEIKERLITGNAQEVNAVLLYDEGEEYPVFLESLHNTIIFPTLIESGYVLESLPYGFVKNGVSFTDLPVSKYPLDAATEELMYNSIGVKLPMDDIKKHIEVKVAKGLPLPPTQYTIFTREDLLKYLDATREAKSDDDYMPLNYFVAPEARFTIQEYRDINNLEYIKLIDNRRVMSLNKFTKLVAGLQKIGVLPINYTAMDVLDAYFSWGMDGLQFTTMNRRRESRAFRLTTNRNVNAAIIDKTYGFVDGAQNLLTPMNQRQTVWKVTNNDPQYLSTITQGMQTNDTKLIEFSAAAKQNVTILEGAEFNIQYSEDTLIMQLQSYPSIRVQSPVSIGEYIDLKLALPNNREALYEYCTIDALAKMIYACRRPHVKVSSYDALTVAGCNPRTVLNYIITKYDMSKEQRVVTEDSAPQIMDFDIDAYLAGQNLNDDIRSFLDDVINGVFNIDEVEQGKSAEASVNTTSVYRELYAVHNVLGISLQEIYDKVKTITPETKSITFSNGELQHTMNVSPLIYATVGYKHDLMNYDLKNAEDCTFFTYVTLIAREVGDERAKRHVGIEFYLVNKKYKPVQEILKELASSYESKVYNMIPNVTQQAQQMRLVNMFALSRYFEIALNGTITWPKVLGGNVEPAMPSQVQTCRKYLERKIENITAYCSFTARTESSRNLTFNAYCTNAYITPEYVIPRSDAPIKEIPFFAAWFNWKQSSPQTWQALVNAGVISPDFEAWECRYAAEEFVIRDLFALDSTDSLLYYYNRANEEIHEYPNDEDFISVTHPVEYMFPGLNKDAESNSHDVLPAPRQGDPVVRLGITHNLVYTDYKDKLLPSESVCEEDSYIRPYRGFSADMFICSDNLLDKIPSPSDILVTVMPKTGHLFFSNSDSVVHYRNIATMDLTGLPIKHIYDRNYLVLAADGKLWEVRI